MKISVLSGSPKGNISITLQYVNYIQKKFPQHQFSIHHISQRIKKIESDPDTFDGIIADIGQADLVLWAVPLYVFLIPSQYKRFIELIQERMAGDAFKGKYTAVITTSVHFYDHTANNYLHAVCDDLEMKYIDFFSPDMYDLVKPLEQERLLQFAQNLFETVERRSPTQRQYPPLRTRLFDYIPHEPKTRIDPGQNVVRIITDTLDEKTNLGRMIHQLKNTFIRNVEVIDLNSIPIKGGCLGCINCGFDYRCFYTGKDAFIEFYNDKIKGADILVFAGSCRDRYLSWKWKQFFDRRFFYTHTPTQTGKQLAYLISGPFSQIPNLRQILSAGAEWEKANLVDIITDEFGTSAEIDALLQNLAQRLVDNAKTHYVRPATFLGVAGMKMFRDEVWSRLRFPFIADHQYYLEHGIYDFPQNDTQAIEFSEKMIEIVNDPAAREKVRKMIKTQMVKPLQQVVEKA